MTVSLTRGGGDWRADPGIGERGHESIMQELDIIKSAVTSRTIARTRQSNWSGSPSRGDPYEREPVLGDSEGAQ